MSFDFHRHGLKLEAGWRYVSPSAVSQYPARFFCLSSVLNCLRSFMKIPFDCLKVSISTPAPLAPRSRNSGLCTFRERLLVLEDLFHYRLRLWFSCQGC